MRTPAISIATFAFAISVLGLSALPARAADMEIQTFDWSGFYAGAQLGYGWGKSTHVPWDLVGVRPLANDDGPADMDSIFGGIHAGYLHQMDRMVLGVEGVLNLNDLEGDDEDRGGHTNGFKGKGNLDLLLRAGYAFDRTLLYATGGWSHLWGDGTVRMNPGLPIVEKQSTSFDGWTLGGGVEHAFTDKLSARLEYRYTDYGRTIETYSTGSGYDLGFSPHVHNIMLGVSYHF
jgi:outer membrane immunogenic protein